jgi:nickel-dependent lactate racemase
MRIEFPYPNYRQIAPCDIPDDRLIGVYQPRALPEVDESRALETGFQLPYGAPVLNRAVGPNDRVLVIIDDATRGTPIARILPYVLAELATAGTHDDHVTFLTAQGTHRRMSEPELRQKLGQFYGRFEVHQHDWNDESLMHEFGHTKDGTRVTANRLLTQADFILGMGSIVPHRVKGFSGGAKIVFPGVSGKEMMYRNQWEASMRMSETVMGEPENSMRLRMEEAAEMAGLRYIVNVISDRDSKIVGCFVGHPVAAHRAGCAVSRDVFTARLPHRADIVLIDAYPADRDFWQSAKAAYAGTMAVREGGTLITVAPNLEGVADNHPNLLQIGCRPQAEIVQMVQRSEIEDLVGAAILADIAQIVDHADCIMVSPGVKREQAERLGFRYAESCQRALDMAFERQGRNASVAVLHQGGHILPLAGPRSKDEERRFSEAAV